MQTVEGFSGIAVPVPFAPGQPTDSILALDTLKCKHNYV